MVLIAYPGATVRLAGGRDKTVDRLARRFIGRA